VIHRLLCRIGHHNWDDVSTWNPREDGLHMEDIFAEPHARVCMSCHKYEEFKK